MKKIFDLVLILLLASFSSTNLLAEGNKNSKHHDHKESSKHDNHEHESSKKEYNAGDMILDHIGDAHDWHLFDYKGHAYSIPLPIIIYNKEKGISVFSSSKFEHGHASFKGYKLVDGKVHNADPANTSSFYDISFTKNVAGMFISITILLLMLFSVKKAYLRREGKAPKGLQSLIETLVVFMRDEVVKPGIGKGYEKFLPLLLTIFFFIFANNMLGLIPFFPGGANVTGNIAITIVLAVIVFIVTHVIAKKNILETSIYA